MKKMRTHLLIYPKFQLSLIAAQTIILVLSRGAVGFEAAQTYSSLRQLGIQAGISQGHVYYRFLDFQAQHLFVHLALAGALGLAISTLVTLALSHRLAGPIVRLKGYFIKFATDKKIPGPLSFRKNDFFSDLPEAINRALQPNSSDKKNEDGEAA